MKIVLFTKTACPRCEDARMALLEARGSVPFELVEQGPEEARIRYPEAALPVVEIDGKVLEGEVTVTAVKAALRHEPAPIRGGLARRGFRWLPMLGLGVVLCVIVISKAFEIFVEPARLSQNHLGLEPRDETAPAFRLADRDGGMVRLEALRGKWVFLNFWATWCESCLDELPSMALLAEELAGEDFLMVAASVDDDWAPIEAFFGDYRPPFLVLLDRDARWAGAYGTEKYPETYLIDPEGRLRAKFTGPRDWSEQVVAAHLRGLLGRVESGSVRRAESL